MQHLVSLLVLHIAIGIPVSFGTTTVESEEAVKMSLGVRTEGNESSDSIDPMPEEIDSTFEYSHGKIHLCLKQHHSCTHPRAGRATQRYKECSLNDISVYTTQDNNDQFRANSQVIPKIDLDDFPRLYASHSRTYTNDAQSASFLVVRNPVSNTFKFFGSFRNGGEQYSIQPSTLDEMNILNTANKDGTSNGAHLMKRFTTIEYSADHMGLFLLGTPTEDSLVTMEPSELSATAVIKVDISVRTSPSPTTQLPQLTSMDMDTKDSRVFKDITLDPTGTTKDSMYTEGDVNNDTDSLGYGHPVDDANNTSHSGGVYDLAELLRRQRKYRYHNSVEHFNKPTTPTTTTTTTEEPSKLIAEKVVEVFYVCDFLCYSKFQDYYKVSEPLATKNAIAQYFTYVRDFHETAYGGLQEDFPELRLAVEIRVVGLYIATQSSHKVIGDYVIGDNKEVDSVPSLFEFVLWVEDTLNPHIRADHYALVTGYDLSGESNFILGLVSNIPSMCQLDSVSVAELWLPITASVMAHELGHSLGADHDGLTNGFCQDKQQFIMAATVGGEVPEENVGNGFSFSNCSALYFQAALQDKKCLERDDFQGSPLSRTVPPVGQVFTLDEQCAALVNNSYTCRENISTSVNGSWDGICSNNLCRLPSTVDTCFEMIPLQFTSCGNKRWCVDGVCVADTEAPEKPVDCPAGDSTQIACNVTQCMTGGYDDLTRFVSCCETCTPLKTERFVVFSSGS